MVHYSRTACRPGRPSGPKARAEATSTVTVVESGTCAAARTRQKPVPKWRLGTANGGSAGPTTRRHSGIPTRPAALGDPPRRSVTWPPKGRRPDRTGKPYNSDPPQRGRARMPAPPRAPECARRRLPTSKLVRRAAVFRGRPGMATGPKMSRRRGRGPRGHPAGGPARAWGRGGGALRRRACSRDSRSSRCGTRRGRRLQRRRRQRRQRRLVGLLRVPLVLLGVVGRV